jgi:uncharacterized protein (DUF885 family)
MKTREMRSRPHHALCARPTSARRVAESAHLTRKICALTILTAFGTHSIALSADKPLTASKRLAKLFTDSDETNLRIHPLEALLRGDKRYADQTGEPFSDATNAAERKAAESDLATINSIDRSQLTPQQQVSYDSFLWSAKNSVEAYRSDIFDVARLRPLVQNGPHASYPGFVTGDGGVEFASKKDYDDGLKRLDGLARMLDDMARLSKLGLKKGIVQPKEVTTRVLAELEDLAAGSAEKQILMPLSSFPTSVTSTDQQRLRDGYKSALKDKVVPAYVRLRDFVKNEYLPAAQTTPGLLALPNGAKYYAHLVKGQTTTEMTPEAINTLGLAEVSRIATEMDRVQKLVPFTGSRQDFFEYLKNDKKFKAASAKEMGDQFRDIQKRVERTLPKLFSISIKSKFEIRPVPEAAAANQAAAYYQPGTPDGSQPGVFYYNTYDLPNRTTFGNETLFLHEGIPGHHFQVSSAQENVSLPPAQRFGGNVAYIEGWALYAESLGQELGLFTDPIQLYGHLQDEMLRAVRLVVDTGLHAKGWTRQQAIDYMTKYLAFPANDIAVEVDRYIGDPGQALGYKIGQLTISRLRAESQKTLGNKFDIRVFHDEVLGSGALPLTVLQAKIRAWTKAK